MKFTVPQKELSLALARCSAIAARRAHNIPITCHALSGKFTETCEGDISKRGIVRAATVHVQRDNRERPAIN